MWGAEKQWRQELVSKGEQWFQRLALDENGEPARDTFLPKRLSVHSLTTICRSNKLFFSPLRGLWRKQESQEREVRG